MAVRLTKPWMTVDEALSRLHGNLGVFELADGDGNVRFIGYASGQSTFGLKAEVTAAVAEVADVAKIRYEVTNSYHSRYRELLMAYQADFGTLPPANPPLEFKLGKLSPA